jgi:hypothetical protein
MRCHQQDDFLTMLNALADADAYVVAAPAYFFSANASLKAFLDRGLQFYAFVDQLWAKPAAGVAIAGVEGREGSTKLGVESFIKIALGDLRGSAVVYGALPGEVLLSPENRQISEKLARAVLDPAQRFSPGAPVCPICGGDTFRFMPGGRARCMLCSGSGPWEGKDEFLRFRIDRGEHPLFLSKEAVNSHAEWLREMKEKFLERRQELKGVVKQYLGTGTIIGKNRQR